MPTSQIEPLTISEFWGDPKPLHHLDLVPLAHKINEIIRILNHNHQPEEISKKENCESLSIIKANNAILGDIKAILQEQSKY